MEDGKIVIAEKYGSHQGLFNYTCVCAHDRELNGTYGWSANQAKGKVVITLVKREELVPPVKQEEEQEEQRIEQQQEQQHVEQQEEEQNNNW